MLLTTSSSQTGMTTPVVDKLLSGLLNGENCTILLLLVQTQYHRVTDRWPDRYATHY